MSKFLTPKKISSIEMRYMLCTEPLNPVARKKLTYNLVLNHRKFHVLLSIMYRKDPRYRVMCVVF